MSPVTLHVLLFGYGATYDFRKLAEEFGDDAIWEHIIESKVTSSLSEILASHRDEVLEAWKATGRAGKCWAQRGC